MSGGPDRPPSGIQLKRLRESRSQHISTVSTSQGNSPLSYDEHGLCECTDETDRTISLIGECSRCHHLHPSYVHQRVLDEAAMKEPIKWIKTTYGWAPT